MRKLKMVLGTAVLLAGLSLTGTRVEADGGGQWLWVDALGHCAAACQNPPYACPCWEAPPIIVKG